MRLACTPWLVVPLVGCLEMAANAPPQARDAGASSMQGLETAGGRPPTRAPLALPDCGASAWEAESYGGGRGSTDPAAASDAAAPALLGPDGGLPASAATAARVPGAAVISEIMSDPSLLGDTQGEWLELYNPAGLPLELQGCLLDDGGGTLRILADPLSIPAGGRITIARGAAPGFTPDHVMPMSLGNSADAVAIHCDGIEVDRVAYGPGFPLAPGASMSLDPKAHDAVANDGANAWCRGEVPYATGFGTPGAPNPPCADDADGGV